MRYTVVLTAEFPRIATSLLAPHFDVVAHPTEHDRTEDDVATLLAEADAAIVLLSDPITRRVLEANPNLRIVSNFAVGYNNIDLDAARERNIAVIHMPGVNANAVAELVLGFMISMTRTVPFYTREVVRGLFSRDDCATRHELRHHRLGIIGLGQVGMRVARLATAFGMRVQAVDPYIEASAFAERSALRAISLDELLATSDVVSVHVPLSRETQHLIDAAALAKMKPGAYLINTARGPIVDEEALCDALDSGHLRGAGLDVYEHEPRVHPRLLAMKNVVLLPHIGSATQEARDAMARIAATNVLLFLGGAEPLHRVV